MDDIALGHILSKASLQELRVVIDWLERPWAPDRNALLRAAYHEACRVSERRGDRTKRGELAGLLCREIYALDYQRGLPFVARKLGLIATGPQSVADEVRWRLSPLRRRPGGPPKREPEMITEGMRRLAERLLRRASRLEPS